MALSLDPATRVISVPQSDLTLVSGTLYSMNTDNFRKDVMDLLASEDYAWMPDAFIHNTAVTVAGTTFARTLEFINSYSITFTPDTGWSVRLEGSNNNIFDIQNGILNQNTVQVIPTNSAGLIGSKQLEDQSFDDSRIWIDIDAGQAGQAYPIGTPGSPVNNLADAQAIIAVRGLPKRLKTRGALTVGATDNIDGYDILGTGQVISSIALTAGCSTDNVTFAGLQVAGTQSGTTIYDHCSFIDLDGFDGQINNSLLGGTITLDAAATTALFIDCVSNVAGSEKPVIDCNSAPGLNVNVREYHGGLALRNYNQPDNNASIDSASLRLELESSCTSGFVVLGGAGTLTNNSAGTFVNESAFNNVSDDEAEKIDLIYRRLDLFGGNIYADDGSSIQGSLFTLTKVDNGNGTFTIQRDAGEVPVLPSLRSRGAVEPPSTGAAGNTSALARGASEPSAT